MKSIHHPIKYYKYDMKVKSLSCVQLFATPWTVAYQAPQSVEFSRQEYWSGVPLPSLTLTLGFLISDNSFIVRLRQIMETDFLCL